MITFNVNGKRGTKSISLPSKLSEVTPEYLLEVSKSIKIANDYSLIAIVYKESPSTLILTANSKKKEATASIVPVFVKSGDSDSNFIKDIKAGDKIIISPSDIALGHHVSAPANTITITNVLSYLEGDKDLYSNAELKTLCYFVEFKLVPNCNIHGNYTSCKYLNSLLDMFIKEGEV